MIVPKERSAKRNYCGPASFAMVARSYGYDFTQEDFASGLRQERELFLTCDLVHRARELGFRAAEYRNCTLQDVEHWLERGVPPIALVRKNAQSPHAIVITGYDRLISYNDPADLRRSKMPISRFTIMWENFAKERRHLLILESPEEERRDPHF